MQEILGDKRSRGAFGEVQLEAIVRNALPESAFEFQYTLARGVRADCVRLLINREAVGSFRDDCYRDVVCLGDIDTKIAELCNLLQWHMK